MADTIKKYKIKQLTGENQFLELHPETDADIVNVSNTYPGTATNTQAALTEIYNIAVAGQGTVKKVNGKSPNSAGEVTLVPSDIGAVDSTVTASSKTNTIGRTSSNDIELKNQYGSTFYSRMRNKASNDYALTLLEASNNANGYTALKVFHNDVSVLSEDQSNRIEFSLLGLEPFASKTVVTSISSSSTNTQIPTAAAVWSAFSVADAMVYKGVLAAGSTESYGALTPAANKGDTYKISVAGKIDGKAVEIGDMLICNTDNTAAATSSNYQTIANNWDIIQANIDGAVTGPANATNNHVAIFNGNTGKIIKDSNLTIGTSVPQNAVFTDTWRDVSVGGILKLDNTKTYGVDFNAGSGLSVTGTDEGVITYTLDADLAAIAALTGTSGLLRKTAANTWTLGTNDSITTTINSGKKTNGTTDITGSGSGTTQINITLGDSGITAATYTACQVNAKGIAIEGWNAFEVGSKSGTNTPSNKLVIGGIFYQEI